MSLKKQTIQGIFWSAIQNWGGQTGSLIVFLILARLLTPEAFGLVALANVFINFMQIFLEQGFAQVLIQRENIDEQHINTAFWTQIILGIILTIISWLTANQIANYFKISQLAPILQCFSILFFINSLIQIQIALLKRNFAFKVTAMRTLLGITIGGIIGVVMSFLGYGVWSIVGQQLSYEIVGVFVLWNASDWRPKLQFSWSHLADLMNFSLNLLGFQLVNFFNQRTDNLLIGYFLGEVALGYYAIAHRILQVMTQLLIGTLNQVALPTFSRLQSDSKRFIEAFYRATQLTSIFAFPVFFAVIILAPELVITLFGEKWHNAIPIMQILSFAGILRSISFYQRSAFMALGQPLLNFKLGLINAIFNLIACGVAVQWGIRAVAVAYVISDYLVFPFSQWLLSQLISIKFKTYLAQFLAPVICTSIMVLTLLFTQKILTYYLNPSGRLVICSMIGIVVYSLTLAKLFPTLFKQIWAFATLLRPSMK
ncbi:flippase [Aphanothece hegewaldii CCALA 016]|uniref:Flippase n=1 Tax=Aphanothece hegewaldii CCALA 016 TaxID=2107694 RepID=A0A2T1LZJ1_9CHRO|nr:lipopolysaccharide biosynthesis protein [Aphanothece hegewaldii]PSF37812.1 flippase [Aphanothece hegewaldii CCALA 016]